MTQACAICGTDSVATCPSCDARVCNRHMVIEVMEVPPLSIDNLHRPPPGKHLLELKHPTGESFATLDTQVAIAFAGGESRCLVCRRDDGEAIVKAAAEAATEADRRRPEEQAKLGSALEPADIARCILDSDERIPIATYQDAWVRLAAAGELAASAELVVMGEPSRFFGRTPREVSRRPAWKVPDAYCWFDEAGVCWERSLATTDVYAVKPGCLVYHKTRRSEVNVEGVRQVRDVGYLQARGVAWIKGIVAESG